MNATTLPAKINLLKHRDELRVPVIRRHGAWRQKPFQGLGHTQEFRLSPALADELQADRQAVAREAAGQHDRRLAGDVGQEVVGRAGKEIRMVDAVDAQWLTVPSRSTLNATLA